MQQITAKVKAVGKYKDKFNSTGLLLEWNGETWVDVKGQLNWKDYKDKTLTLDVEQNNKGYWSGSLSNTFGGQQSTPQTQQNAPQQAQDKPDWDKIAEGKVMCNVICSAIQSNQMQCTDMNDAKMYTDLIMGKKDVGRQIADLRDDTPSF
jgi:hypothetical protein